MRLDKKLQEQCPDISRSQIVKCIHEGKVTVNGEKALKVSMKIKEGDSVEYVISESKEATDEACLLLSDIQKYAQNYESLDILYECDDYFVINKMKGVSVHRAANTPPEELTVADLALLYCNNLSSCSGESRPGIVHRLDKDTTGVLIIAKNNIFHAYLAKKIKELEVKKMYYAIVLGSLEDGIINAPIYRSVKDRKKMAVRAGGKEAKTQFKVLAYCQKYDVSFVEVRIFTGRTHQIRVHFSSIGHPVVGDDIYGNTKVNQQFQEQWGVSSQMLHSYNYSFIDCDNNEKSFVAKTRFSEDCMSECFPDYI
jgi:23S rRNA pseudouridine1911/1915/1917 synthase